MQTVSYKLAQKLVERATEVGAMVATAESCTGGGVAAAITDVAGSSAVLDCGIVSYANAAKQRLLDVSAETLDRFGAVSQPVAEAMLAGLWSQSGADIGIAITGIAGPGGGSDEKPVGTVCFAWGARKRFADAVCMHFDGDRVGVRAKAVDYALNQLLDTLDRL